VYTKAVRAAFRQWADASLQRLSGYRRFAGYAFRASPGLAAVTALATLVSAAAPLATAFAVGAVVGQLPAVVRSGLGSPAGQAAIWWTCTVGLLFVLGWAVGALQSAAATALGDRVDFALQRELMAAVMAPVGIGHLEDPRTLDLVNVGRDGFRSWLRPGRLTITLTAVARARIVLLGGVAILAGFRWPMALALLAAALWVEREAKAAASRAAEHHYGESPQARRTDYYFELGVTPGAAKEVRIFGLAPFLMDRFVAAWRQATAPVFARGSRRLPASASVLGAVALGALAWVCLDAVGGRVGLGAATVYAQAILVALGGLGAAADAGLRSEMAMATLRRSEAAVEAVRPARAAASRGSDAGRAPEREIRFERVRFRYPDGAGDVLEGLDLVVPAGRSLAIVGANGAGKTTVVKLLCRLYEPAQGRVLVDGHDLAGLDPASWRRRVAAVFQDHVRYAMTVRSNVGFGHAPAQDDLPGLRAAASDAGVEDVIEALPRGWETVLSADYQGGSDLSVGEWQGVALARALFAIRHGARVLVLDEPAANLDARAEAQLYERFLALTGGLTTIVISHRFSTVRQASSIVVLRDGRVAEQGSHEELLAAGGQYAEMYRLQARRFSGRTAESAVAEP
jgi:ATP-binding cassette, subfamily B, bacterial